MTRDNPQYEENLSKVIDVANVVFEDLTKLDIEYMCLFNLGKSVNAEGKLEHKSYTAMQLNPLSFMEYLLGVYKVDRELFDMLAGMFNEVQKMIDDSVQ